MVHTIPRTFGSIGNAKYFSTQFQMCIISLRFRQAIHRQPSHPHRVQHGPFGNRVDMGNLYRCLIVSVVGWGCGRGIASPDGLGCEHRGQIWWCISGIDCDYIGRLYGMTIFYGYVAWLSCMAMLCMTLLFSYIVWLYCMVLLVCNIVWED